MIDSYFNRLTDVLDTLDRENIQVIANIIRATNIDKGSVYVFGNGGSATTASHFAQDMNKTLSYRFVCLNDNIPSLLAYGNDVGFESIFKLQLEKLIGAGDLVIGISCSGNSENVLSALEYANMIGCPTIGFAGYDGGKLKYFTDYCLHVPSFDMQICEDCHLILTHIIMKLLQ